MSLGFDVTKYIGKTQIATVLVGILSANFLFSGAFAQEQIRLNPDYKAPSLSDSSTMIDDIRLEDIDDDFDQFLNRQEDSGQYIQLIDPKEAERSAIALSPDQGEKAPLLQLNHNFQYDPSLSFSMAPGLIGGDIDSNNADIGLGGSQVILSLNPSRQELTPFNRSKTVELILGSSFINRPLNNYNSILQSSFTSQRAYNLSMGIGYSGFKVGASISRSNSLFSSNLTGYDLGFGYRSDNWSANFRIGEYNKGRQFLIGQDYNFFDNVSAYELGGAYRLFSNLSLTGRFTYYSYGLGADIAPLEDVKSLILGTNLSF